MPFIVSRTISNDAYVFGVANQNTSYAINGRNEIVSAGGSSFSYDSNRNVTNDGTRAYAYDAANQMTSAGSISFSYDPSGALYDVGSHRLASVGGERLALYTTSGGALHRRIVPGAGLDEAAAYYHGAGTTTRQWPLADQLGSVIAYANASGAAANINTYDEYGRPGPTNAEFLQYTGQLAIASAPGVYNYRNRFYQADIGRFLQTDPIGYGAGLNLYAYVGNNPINLVDPWGLDDEDPIVVVGRRPRLRDSTIVLPHVLIDDVGTTVSDSDQEIVVTASRLRRSFILDRRPPNPRRGNDEDPVFSCFLAQYEFSIGAQAFLNGGAGIVSGGALGDAGSLRMRIGLSSDGFFAYNVNTRGTEVSLGVGYGLFGATETQYSRQTRIDREWGLVDEGTEYFAGIALGAGLLFGHDVKIGLTSATCPHTQ